jgi:serine phosphatase RsbU (regulator of sigma subunit)
VARYNLYQAQTLEGLGRTVEAAKAFDAFRTTQFATTPEGRIMANDYLFAAQRWGEAADNYQSLDALLAQQGGMNLENIRDLLLKKYQANLLAGRRDSAAAVSMLICDSITGAFAKAKYVDAEEQATIVRKVEEVGAQQVTDARRKQLEELCLFALVLLLVVGYVIYRRYRHHLLHKAHDELREDYGQLEATATERSRTATEQRLAAAMQEYVAHQPQTRRDDLTLLVAQTPGTMAGGSFCETIQQGNTLLFAIGSATGKGVAAATTSAMAWAQFRTAAAITSAPEAIVTAISEAIADSKHLPVRLFVGALNLTNGELNYSNAGNNTPLLMADELALLTDDDSTPAGSHLGTVYKACTTTLDKGKFLFLYANGVAEATDTNGKPLGDNHLRGMALQTAKIDPSPEPFFSHIQKAIAGYTGARPQVSDITFIVIARK